MATVIAKLLAVALGGALGAVSRYGFGALAVATLGTRFPWSSFGVNVIGSLAIGVAAVLIGDRVLAGELWRPLFVVGFLGAFTTFSAFSLDALLLLQQGNYNSAFAYVAASVLVCLVASYCGMQLAKLFL